MNAETRALLQQLADRWASSPNSRFFADDLQEVLDASEPGEDQTHPLHDELESIRTDLQSLGHDEGIWLRDLPDRISAIANEVWKAEESGAIQPPAKPEPEEASGQDKKAAPVLPPGVTSTQDVFDGDILLQSEVWKDRHGNLLRLTDMTEGYLRNVLSYLEGRAAFLCRSAVQREMTDMFRGIGPDDDMPSLSAVNYPDPATWLRATPLVTRINQLLTNTH